MSVPPSLSLFVSFPPSLQNQLTDGCVIQLYLKANNHYLSVNGGGVIQNIVNGNDKNST